MSSRLSYAAANLGDRLLCSIWADTRDLQQGAQFMGPHMLHGVIRRAPRVPAKRTPLPRFRIHGSASLADHDSFATVARIPCGPRFRRTDLKTWSQKALVTP